jgi:hypothetical protein
MPESRDWTTIIAEETRAPVKSCTVPRNEPREFCALEKEQAAATKKIAGPKRILITLQRKRYFLYLPDPWRLAKQG